MFLSLLFAETKPCVCMDQPMTECEVWDAIKRGLSDEWNYGKSRHSNRSYGWGSISLNPYPHAEIYTYREKDHKFSEEEKATILKTAIQEIVASKMRYSVVFVHGATSKDWLSALKKIAGKS